MEKKVTRKEARAIYLESNKRVVDDTAEGFVVLRDVDKIYPNNVQAVHHFNLSVKQNEFIVLVGPSGCGKSTTLRMIAGLEEITKGYLYIDRVMANYLESKDRDIAMVFQSYALYPNMSVFENMAFGLRVRGVSNEEITQKVFDAAKILDLGAYLDRKPRELSGGQMQRVALGRAIVRDAKLFLMDEPLSNLDAKLRVQMRSEIVKLHKDIHTTTIYVTHDQTEAMTMADRIVIMNKGFVQQVGTPREIYDNPANIFVATFIGNPPMNIFSVKTLDGTLDHFGQRFRLPSGCVERFREHSAEKLKFFQELRLKADMSRERALGAELRRVAVSLKKLQRDGTLGNVVDKLVKELQALSEEKGFFTFGSERGAALVTYAQEGNFKTLKHEITVVEEELFRCNLAVSGILKETGSGLQAIKKDAATVVATSSKKKASKPTSDEMPTDADNIRDIDNYIAAYAQREAGELVDLTLGIRPESIFLVEKFEGRRSDTITITADFVELLGSEYCVHFTLFGARMIFKTGIWREIRTGDKLDVCFDLDRLKIFDAVSGKSITFTDKMTAWGSDK